MEIAIIKRETVGISSPPDTEPIAKYEIMDGAPVRGTNKESDFVNQSSFLQERAFPFVYFSPATT